MKRNEWKDQWQMFYDEELFLFKEWISPYTLENFRYKSVLDCGCGCGFHAKISARYAKDVTAVDLNTIDMLQFEKNITYIQEDMQTMDLKRKFDVIYCLGVVHHLDDPEKGVENMLKHLKKGGDIIIWVYSREGNWLMRYITEPLRKAFLKHADKKTIFDISRIITAFMYIPIYTIYLLPRSLPYHAYFNNFRRLDFRRNLLNVFDKLNAPQTQFIAQERAFSWVSGKFREISVDHYLGASWRIVGFDKM